MLSLQGIEVSRDNRVILTLEHLHIAPDQFTVILGHNGSGKSTLLNLIARQIIPDRGYIELLGKPLNDYRQREFAQRIAFLPQSLPRIVLHSLCLGLLLVSMQSRANDSPRVVALSWEMVEHLLKLNITPIAVADAQGVNGALFFHGSGQYHGAQFDARTCHATAWLGVCASGPN